MQNSIENKTLVIGGKGKTGRRIVEGLLKRGQAVRIGSRSAEVPFDWNDRSTWEQAIHGCNQIYITYVPDLAVPGATDAITSLCDLAAKKCVQKLVLLSGRGEPEAQACERIVQESGLAWTVIRCSWFNQNFNENFLLDYVNMGMIALPVGDVLEPFVDADDIADVAVAALTDSKHDGELYELTGPELLSFREVAGILSEVTERRIDYVNTPHETFLEGLENAGVPEEYIQLLDYLFANVLDGRNAYLADGVQRALGRKPRRFADFAKDAAKTGAWNAENSLATTDG